MAVGVVAFVLVSGVAFGRDDLASVTVLWLGMTPVHLAAFGAALFLLRWRGPRRPFPRVLALDPAGASWPTLAGRCIGVVLPLYVVAYLVTVLAALLLPLVGYTPAGSPLDPLLMHETDAAFWASVVLVTLFLGPLAEEILFRLVFFEMLRGCGIAWPAALTSLAFAAIHQIPERLPALFLLGLVLQRARTKSGSLWLPVAVHAAFNAITIGAIVCVRLLAG